MSLLLSFVVYGNCGFAWIKFAVFTHLSNVRCCRFTSHRITLKIRCLQIFKCVSAAILSTYKWYSSPTPICASSFYASFSWFYCTKWHKWWGNREWHNANVCWQLVWRRTPRYGGKLCNDIFQHAHLAMSKVFPLFASLTIKPLLPKPTDELPEQTKCV